MTRRIGFVGLGHMGGAIALRLLAAGEGLVVHDLSQAAMAGLAAAGAEPAASVEGLAARCDAVFLCLPSLEASAAVAREIAAAAAVPRVVVETSTVGPASVRALCALFAPRGIGVVDAPVSGGPRGARAGSLSVMCAGKAAHLELVAGQIDAIAGRKFVVGEEPGLAQFCKLVNNAISAAGMVAACEAMVAGVKAGLDAQVLLDAVNAGSGRNAATLDKFPAAILSGSFDYGGPLGLMLKDLSLFIEECRAMGLHGRMTPAALAGWQEAVDRSGPDADYSELIRHMEIDAKAEVRAVGGR